jgi:hypothetical protein
MTRVLLRYSTFIVRLIYMKQQTPTSSVCLCIYTPLFHISLTFISMIRQENLQHLVICRDIVKSGRIMSGYWTAFQLTRPIIFTLQN